MRVGILGSTGQIGKAIAEHLATRTAGRYTVRAAVRSGRKPAFSRGVETVVLDFSDPESFDALLESVDHVVYAIGAPEQWVPDSAYFHRVNVTLLEAFLQRMLTHRGKSLTYISTFEVFSPLDGIVRESRPMAEKGATPYYQSMVDAYRMARALSERHDFPVLFIHPAAVYGGLNTGMAITDYLLNLKHGRFWRVPAVPAGAFPLVHVESLADGIEKALSSGRFGESYLFADVHVSLRELAEAAKAVERSAYRPIELPPALIRPSVAMMEAVSRLTRRPPLISAVQVKYITQGIGMDCSKAIRELGWERLNLEQGVRRLFRGDNPA
ncbi:MAG TPA: NAD-dependent epimerase/dehydratase family protein [Fibrobacteria bacterium]|nr:NAD-dependent epimerase/dehydratase family protein [Fibrobacteria bacterium]